MLQVLKGIGEVRAIKGKLGSLECSMFVGDGPDVPMGLKLFTKVGTGQWICRAFYNRASTKRNSILL